MGSEMCIRDSPSTVARIGVDAFGWCSNLKSITLSDNLKTIDSEALAKSLATEIKYDDTLKELTADEISMLVDLPEDVDSVMYAGSGSTAEEVGVFTAKDSNQAKETMEDVQKYLDDQADSFQDYVPEETKRIGNAVLEQKNQYVVLCVSGDSDQAKEIIEKAFK